MFAEKDSYRVKLKQQIEKIVGCEPSMRRLSDDELVARGDELRTQVKNGQVPEKNLIEAYALVREVIYRISKIRLYDEQIMGAIALYNGLIIEMQNGEGKTFVAISPAYLRYLSGQRVHIATDNDYLASRDALWMGPIYAALGMSVGIIEAGDQAYRVILNDSSTCTKVSCTRKDVYSCDVVYGAHTEFVFNYLDDNLALDLQNIVMSDYLDYIILDEADSALIDRARTPVRRVKVLGCDPDWYRTVLEVCQQLQLTRDYDRRTFELTEQGMKNVENLLKMQNLLKGSGSLYDTQNAGLADQLLQSLRAIHLYKRDREYIVKDGMVMPVDSSTGRPLRGGGFSNGVQQAVQAKEGVPVTPETVPLAEISYQHFFKLYKAMAGMTATARERSQEFLDVYGKAVIEIPLHQPNRRKNLTDLIYRTPAGRLNAVLAEVEEMHTQGRPVLINTLTVEKAEELVALLVAEGIPCSVLHARHYEQEASIIQKAGSKGAVTVSAKMAGRGTDIRIEEDVAKLGGLHVIGIERNLPRYMDRQLTGRAGRQGKPGSSRFFLSLEDELMVRFAANRIASLMQRMGMEEDVPLESDLVSRLIRSAQAQVEKYSFEERQRAYQFDSVLDQQRKLIYAIRRKAIWQGEISVEIQIIIENVVARSMERYFKSKRQRKHWDIKGLASFFSELSYNRFPKESLAEISRHEWKTIEAWLINEMLSEYEQHKKKLRDSHQGEVYVSRRERQTLLRIIDTAWQTHLLQLQDLQDDMFLRANLEENSLGRYAQESYTMFWEMVAGIEKSFLHDMLSDSLVISEANNAELDMAQISGKR